MFDHETFEFSGAAYRQDGSLILQSLRPARLGHWRPVDPVSRARLPQSAGFHLPEAIYGGHFFNIWGHMLLETLSTAVVARSMPQAPIIFTPFAPGADPAEFDAAWQRSRPLIAAAGWGDRPLLLQAGPLTIERLIVPERISVYANPIGSRLMLDEMRVVYDGIRHSIAPSAKPANMMIAARPWWTPRKHPAEEQFYDLMAARGALVVNGVDLAPTEQARLFASASAVVGFAGSNLHNSVFAQPETKVFEIGDERSYQAGGVDLRNWTQVAMCGVLDQPLTFIESFQSRDLQRPKTAEDIADAIAAAL